MSQQDKDWGDSREEWKTHPYASLVKKRISHELGMAESQLRIACGQSTDPKVRAAFEKLQAVKQFLDLLENGVAL